MSAKNKASGDPLGREFVITRKFAAPRGLVFQAWTEPRHLAEWWGPRGFTNPVCEWEAQPGGRLYDVMRAPNGAEFPMGGRFTEVVAPERLVFTCGALDESGKLMFEFRHEATFVERRGQTELTLRSRVTMTTPGAGRYIGGFELGMSLSLERLVDLLATLDHPLVIARTLAAPVARVWQALTSKAAMKAWGFAVSGFQPKVGCEFRFTGENQGMKYYHHCKITEVVPRRRLVHTWRYAGHEGDSVVRFELLAEGGKTRLRLTHTGLGSFPKTPAFARANFKTGWTHLIGTALKKYVEAKPVRAAKKPRVRR